VASSGAPATWRNEAVAPSPSGSATLAASGGLNGHQGADAIEERQGCSSSSPRRQMGGDTAHDLNDCNWGRPAAGHGRGGSHSNPEPPPIAGPRCCHPTTSPSRRRAAPGAAHPSKRAAGTPQQAAEGWAFAGWAGLEEASQPAANLPYGAHVRPVNRSQPSWGLGNLLRTSRQTTPF